VAEVPGRRFGLLTSCTHAFCVECIREWRGRIDLPVATTRSCPICRTLSYFIIPCDRFVADAGRKAAVHTVYHSSQRAIPCKHYDLGRGVCPFGASCFYEHRGLDGTLAAASGRHTFLMDSEGSITGGRAEYKLAAFL
jgi:E3 ubiquitin-protein ligase makorin